MSARIKAISYYLPQKVLTNNELAALYEGWTADKIFEKTGINQRHIVDENECTSDLAERACQNLFNEYNIDPKAIDFILLVTQSPDYFLPSTSCILQDKLGIPKKAGAFDINLGCSGYVYGLATAKSLVNSNIAKNVLLVTSEIYTKHIHPMDKSTRTIFGDGAAATLITHEDGDNGIGEFIFGSDGSGANDLIIPAGGLRMRPTPETRAEYIDSNGSIRTKEHIFMNGPEIFNFTIKVVPQMIRNALDANKLQMNDIDMFVFHQANKFILDYLRKKMNIPENKFYVNLEKIGNTVSSTIPIALRMAENERKIKTGDNILLVGFGVGLSWAATVIKW